jgi:hypothetical protein
MMKNQLHLLLLALLVSFGYRAQKTIKVSLSAELTFNRYGNNYMVLDDSLGYYEYSLRKQVWERKPLQLQLEIPFQDFKERFVPISIDKGVYYFVSSGCGIIYELRNGLLRRIDQSFDHKNQFESAMYEYRHKVYMFGGYGLFEVKNTHTFYEPVNREWFQVAHRSETMPDKRSNPYRVKQGNNLYIMGGLQRRFNQVNRLNDIWQFNMKTKEWRLLGELSPDFVERTRIRGFLQNKDYSIFTYNDKLTILQLEANKYYTYKSPFYWNINRVIASFDRKYLLVARHNSNTQDQLQIKITKLKSMLIGVPKENYLYKPVSIFKQISFDTYLWISILLNIGFFFLLFYVRRITKTTWYRPKKPVLLRNDFSEMEWVVLKLIQNREELELSALNDFFDEPGLSHETLKKRRESFLKALRIKLALLTRRDVDTLLPESKHALDKRMKIISWNKDLLISAIDSEN